MRPGKILFALAMLGSLAACYPPTQSSYNTPVWEQAQVTWGGGLRTTYWGHGKTSTVIPTSWSP
jgi:hypothetical protein